MKKQIVVVDDRPWKMLESVKQLQNGGCIFL